MALSNIFRETRRELTETLVGVACVAPLLALDFWFALCLQANDPSMSFPGALFLGMFILFPIGLVLTLVLIFIHTLGEITCDALDRRGLHLRPRRRY